MAAGIFVLISFTSYSQEDDHHTPAWVSDKGYWVVEDNIHQPLQHLVRFYNNHNILVGMQDISGAKLNLKKRKVKMQLKSMLETSLLVWEKKRSETNEPALVKAP